MEYLLACVISFLVGFMVCALQVGSYTELKSEQKAELSIDGKKYKVVKI